MEKIKILKIGTDSLYRIFTNFNDEIYKSFLI